MKITLNVTQLRWIVNIENRRDQVQIKVLNREPFFLPLVSFRVRSIGYTNVTYPDLFFFFYGSRNVNSTS